MRPLNILILHHSSFAARQTRFIAAFAKYCGPHSLFYLDASVPLDPDVVTADWDVVLLNYCFMGLRRNPAFEKYREKFAFLRDLAAVKIALPQDDHTYHIVLDEWLDWLRVDQVCSPRSKHIDLLYPKTSTHAEFRHVLTGYVEAEHMARLEAFTKPFAERRVDVGNRVRLLTPNFGRHGMKKGEFALGFADRAREAGFNVDVSADPNDVFIGDDWLHFLGDCRFAVAAKGGTSLNDPDGTLKSRVLEYMEANPEARFEEVEAACFPGRDGKYIFDAAGPRFFDCAAMGTVQILPPDEYFGVMEPMVHYIPANPDCSNLDAVFDVMRDHDKCVEIADACHDVLIASGQFSAETFVRSIYDDAWRHLCRRFPERVGKAPRRLSVELAGMLETLDTFMCDCDKLGPVLSSVAARLVRNLMAQDNLAEALEMLSASTEAASYMHMRLRGGVFPHLSANWTLDALLRLILAEPDKDRRAILYRWIRDAASGDMDKGWFSGWRFIHLIEDGRFAFESEGTLFAGTQDSR